VQRPTPLGTAGAILPAAAAADRWEEIFRADLEADIAFERRLFFREGWIIVVLTALVLLLETIQ
jgi:hypothetical protein